MSTTPPDGPEQPQQPEPPASPPTPPGYGTPPNYGTPPGGGYPPSDPYGGYGGPPPPPPTGPGGPASEPWSVGNALTYGWDRFVKNIGPILLLALLVLVGLIAFSVISTILQNAIIGDSGLDEDGTINGGGSFWAGMGVNGLFAALNWIAQTVLGAFLVRAALDVTEGRRLEFGSIFGRVPLGPILLLGLLNAVIVGVGVVLCIIPGLIAAFVLSYSTYFLLDRGMPPVDALKASFDLVKNNVGKALVWAFVAFIVGIVGLCLCGVGFLVTFPIAMIGTAYTYKKLTGQPVAA